MKTICLVSGGPEYLLPEKIGKEDATFIGVDEGILFLRKRNIVPAAAFGDFDSITDADIATLKNEQMAMFTFEQEKDMTDLELALQWAFEQKPDRIELYGATGGRLDHELINMQLLKQGLDRGIETVIIDRTNEVMMKKSGRYSLEQDERYPYVSFIPFSSEVKGITLEGFKYPLYQAGLVWGSTLCISNELVTKKGTYSFEDGIIMVVRSKD